MHKQSNMMYMQVTYAQKELNQVHMSLLGLK